MNMNPISLSKRTEFPHSYVLTSGKHGQEEQSILASSERSLMRLQCVRLAVQNVTDPYFKGNKRLIGRTVGNLKGGKVTPWKKMSDAKLLVISQRASQIAFKKILRDVEWERLYEYLQNCQKKLRDNFHQFHLQIKEKKGLH